MQNQRSCLVVLAACLLAAVSANGVPSRSERATTVNCAAQLFTNLDKCGIPVVNLLSSAAVTSCGTVLSLLPIFKSYVINGAQDANNVLTFANQITQNAFGDRICYVECAMRASNYFNADNSLKYAQIKTEFAAAVPATLPTMVTVVKNAADLCQLKTAAPSPKTITSAKGVVCLLQPTLYYQCIREQILLNYTPKTTTGTICPPLFTNLAACNPFV